MALLSLQKIPLTRKNTFLFPPDLTADISKCTSGKWKNQNISVCCFVKECKGQNSGCTSTLSHCSWQCHTEIFFFSKRWIDRIFFPPFLFFEALHKLEFKIVGISSLFFSAPWGILLLCCSTRSCKDFRKEWNREETGKKTNELFAALSTATWLNVVHTAWVLCAGSYSFMLTCLAFNCTHLSCWI